jgi:hypothetical protein
MAESADQKEKDQKGSVDKPSADKKAEALIALFQGCFSRRTELEAALWKVNLSVWTSIGIVAWAFHTRPEILSYWSLIFLLIIPLHSFAIYMLDSSIKTAVTLALAYVADLEVLIGHRHESRPAPLLWWHFMLLAPTAVLAIAAVMLTF